MFTRFCWEERKRNSLGKEDNLISSLWCLQKTTDRDVQEWAQSHELVYKLAVMEQLRATYHNFKDEVSRWSIIQIGVFAHL